MDKISIIVPCFNEEESIPLFYDAISEVAAGMKEQEFEFIFIDDGSKDRTLPILRELHQKDKRVRYISFSRNFGKEAGMYAGLSKSTGDFVAIMDVDMQDPPSLLPEMYRTLKEEDYDSVATRRSTREGEPKLRSFFAIKFYEIINAISDADIISGARDYRLMKRVMVDAILSMKEYNRFSKGIFGWVGFKTKWLSYENIERVAGVTKWSFWKLFVYAINGIVAFSTVPLLLPLIFGILFTGIGVIFMIIHLITKASLLYDVLFLLTGVLLICLGVVAQYLAKTYLEVLKRPVYIERETEEGSR
ncbi:MAG: glycosyltransferase family 2 protein [Erysipelotrichaceae bacterium]|nr:glycosyltransferase family 2 protein [Erysipelotrichaceae bacterium]